jgi:hypothetical protein
VASKQHNLPNYSKRVVFPNELLSNINQSAEAFADAVFTLWAPMGV